MKNMREKVKELWRICFDDSEEFTDMYFNLRYSNEVNVAIESGGELIAALQMLPYPMTFGGATLPTAYISGACTRPDYRSRGVMRQLLAQAFGRMYRNNTALTTLIPAEPWLFGYYARAGYATAFRYARRTFRLPAGAGASLPRGGASGTGWCLNRHTDYDEAVYHYLNTRMQERPCCLQHTKTDFHVILADLKLSNGCLFTLSDGSGIAAFALAYPGETPSQWRLGELLSDTPEAETQLLTRICRATQTESLSIITPPAEGQPAYDLGMIRIIRARKVLQLYAASHPDSDLSIHLTDNDLPANNGYYRLHQGKCTYSPRQLPGAHEPLTIVQLAGKLFAPEQPYMSLMLN